MAVSAEYLWVLKGGKSALKYTGKYEEKKSLKKA